MRREREERRKYEKRGEEKMQNCKEFLTLPKKA